MFGCWILYLLMSEQQLDNDFKVFLTLIDKVYWFLLTYAIAFFVGSFLSLLTSNNADVVPLVRFLYIQWSNSTIDRRNKERKEKTAKILLQLVNKGAELGDL